MDDWWNRGGAGVVGVHDQPRLLHHTHILDVIRSYGLVVGIYGALSYNNDVKSFLVGTVLEGHRSKQRLENAAENILHRSTADACKSSRTF